MKKVIGITGSIGSGKSYAIDIFKRICKERKINAIFLDVDDIRRNILKKEKIDREQLNKNIYNSQKAMEEYKKVIDFILNKNEISVEKPHRKIDWLIWYENR